MKNIKMLSESEEMKEIIKNANFIKSFGSIFEYRINRIQPKNKIIKLIKTSKINEELESTIKYFFKLTDLYNYLAKGSKTVNNRLEMIVLETPLVWSDFKYDYITEYVNFDSYNHKLYKLNLIDLIDAINISYWLDENDNLYKRIEAQDRYDKRIWQYNQAGNKCLIIKGKTLSLETLRNCKTTEAVII